MYDAFLGAHGRVHSSAAEYQQRVDIFASNAELVDAHNRDESKGFQLGLNRFADMSQVCLIPAASVCPVIGSAGCGLQEDLAQSRAP